MTLTDQILGLLDDERSSDAWLDLAERAVVDTVAVLVAGSTDPAVGMVVAAVDEHDGPVTSLATGTRMSTRSAALVDGTAAHALDFDDVDDTVIGHPSAVLVPALLAAAQETDADGLAVLHAYRVGLETARAVGAALDVPSHYAAGWHSTSTIGTVAVAAAGARLLGLDPITTRHALGIAGSLACGSRQNFGTMTKPLHAGTAASQGLTAARLARAGFTADPGQLDGPLGFLALHRAPGARPQRPYDSSGDPHGLDLKLFPCCYATHTAIEAALGIAARDGHRAGGVVAVDAVLTPAGAAPLVHHRPADGTQAKFSLEYTVAVALIDRGVTLASFTDQRVRRSDVQDLLRRVDVTAAPSDDAAPWAVSLSVRYADGTTANADVAVPLGHASRSLDDDRLRHKVVDCFGAETAEVSAAHTALRALRDEPSVRSVTQRVVAASSAARTAVRR